MTTSGTIELRIEGIAKEGDGVGRDRGGRVTFVRGALPGELVSAEIVDERKTFARARLVDVEETNPSRVEPACPAVAAGCGGCDLQHAAPSLARELKLRIVSDAWHRIGKLDVQPTWGGGIEPFGYRTTARCVVSDGRAGFRQHHAHDPVIPDACLTVHPLVRAVMADGDFGRAAEVVIRASVSTGERIVAAAPRADGVRVPAGVVVVGADELRRTPQPARTEAIAGRDWQVSIGSFLQASPVGAGLLVATVRAALDEASAPDGPLVDLYAGIGLLAGSVGADRSVVAVEANPYAVADARVNLEGQDVAIVQAKVEDWQPAPASVVVADPPRTGLGPAGVAKLDATGARQVVLVSCDAAAGARDVRALVDRGFELDTSTVLDLFPQTAHVEVVSSLVRAKRTARSVQRTGP